MSLFILQISPPSIITMDHEGNNIRILQENLGGTPDGIILDPSHKRLFWTNMGENYNLKDGYIERASFDGSNREFLLGKGQITTPKQLIFDEKKEKIYWCDREGCGVYSADNDGKNLQCLIDRSKEEGGLASLLNQCVGIALDVQNKKLIWTQKGPPKGGKGRIFRANLAIPANETAQNRSDIELIMKDLPEPIDLEIDPQNNLLYWTDRGAEPFGNSLNVASLTTDGLENHHIICTGFQEAIGLALDLPHKRAFVGDLGGHIWSINLTTGEKKIIYKHGKITGLALLPHLSH